MFQSHLDDAPVMAMPSGLGQDPSQTLAPIPADQGSKDVAIPQSAIILQKWKPVITIVIVAAITYALVKAASGRKKKKKNKN